MSEMKCRFCGKPFTAIRDDTAEYCSAKCRVYANRRKSNTLRNTSVTPSTEVCVPPEQIAFLEDCAVQIRKAQEMCERGLEEERRALRTIRDLVPDLLAEIERLKADNAELQGCLDEAEAEIAASQRHSGRRFKA